MEANLILKGKFLLASKPLFLFLPYPLFPRSLGLDFHEGRIWNDDGLQVKNQNFVKLDKFARWHYFFFFGKIRWYSYSLSWRFFVLHPNMLPISEPSLDKLILWRKQERREKKMYFCAGVTFSTHFLIDYMISSSQWLIIKGDTECIRRKIKNRKVRYRQVYYSNQKYFD